MADDPVFEAGTARLPIGTKISADDVGGALYQRVKLVWGADGTVVETDSLTATALPIFVSNAASIGGGTGLVSLTGSYIDAVSNALRVTLTAVPSHLVSVTGTVSVVVLSHPEVTLTGSYVDAASNAIRGSLTAASRLISLTGTVSVVVLSHPEVTLTGSYVDHTNNAIRGFIVNPISLSAGVTVASLTVTVKSGLVSLTGSYVDAASNALRVSITGAVNSTALVSLTGSYIDGTTNTITTSLTGASRLTSITGTVSVIVLSHPEVTLTGSYVDAASNAIRGSLTAASRLFSLTGTASVQITSAVSLSVQITSMIVPVSLTGSFISANNALRVEGTLTFSVAVTSSVPISLTGSYVSTNNALRVEGTLTFLAETRFAAPATSKLTRALISFSTTGSSTIVAGVGGQTIRLHRIMVTFAVATGVQIESSTSALTGNMNMPANGAIILDYDGEPWFITSTADPLRLHADTTGQVSGAVWYTQS